ncbi:MAG: sulfotransferase family protein [Bacteroidota bacterium]
MAEKTITRISLWSGPRNISTALMYSFAQRADTQVFDEPLYAHYLSNSLAQEYHPGAEDILASQENNGQKVVEMMRSFAAKPVAFFKNMTHHLLNLDRDFLSDLVNVILTRDPREMLPSFAKVISAPSMQDVGYQAHLDLLEDLEKFGKTALVVDSKNILMNPEKGLQILCKKIGIPFDSSMLSWEAGPRPEDGIWAQYWYASVHRSTAFTPYRPKEEAFPEHLEALYKECQPIYEKLMQQSIV